MNNVRWLGFAGLVVLAGCGTNRPGNNNPVLTDGGSSVASMPPDPFSVRSGSFSEGTRQNAAVRRAIFTANTLGSAVFQEAMGRALTDRSIVGNYVDRPQQPLRARSAELTGIIDPGLITPDVPAGISGAQCGYAVQPPAIPQSARSCRDIVSNAIAEAMDRIDREVAQQPLPDSEIDGAYAPEEVRAWYATAAQFTVSSSMQYALDALRNAGVCDQAPTQVAAAFERGVAQGQQLMQQVTRAQEAQTTRAECDIRNIVNPARNQAMGQAPGLSNANPLCPSFSGSAAEMERLGNAQGEFLRGIQQGIVEQSQLEENRLVRSWVCDPPPPPQAFGGGGGDGGGGGGGGDPLVLDLDGNGVQIEAMNAGAVFDFGAGPTATEWIYGDAFLVLDGNSDGAVQTSEIFGDVHVTADGARAADGLAALALYDDRRRGGNGDGLINNEDAIYTHLSVWTDRNGDGDVDGGELNAAANVVSEFNTSTGAFTLQTGEQRSAADVWFRTAR